MEKNPFVKCKAKSLKAQRKNPLLTQTPSLHALSTNNQARNDGAPAMTQCEDTMYAKLERHS